ncbi:MAG: hypothetical protein K2I06_14025 [Ruminococcus sp.]|nr:hypothetical protein [Ruminococcus sp.]
MSRSYKKFPVIKDRARISKDRFKPKTYANRAVRRYKDFPTGKSCFFKKIYCSWFICDYRFIPPSDEKEFKRQWESEIKDIAVKRKTYNYKEAFISWKISYINK